MVSKLLQTIVQLQTAHNNIENEILSIALLFDIDIDIDKITLLDDDVHLLLALPFADCDEYDGEYTAPEEQDVEEGEMIDQSDCAYQMLEIGAELGNVYTQVRGRLDCSRITADRKQMPYIYERRSTRVSVDRMLSRRLRKTRSKKFFMLIENDLTLEIIRQPMNPNDMYCDSFLKVSLMFSFRIHTAKFRHRVMGSVLSLRPLIMFHAVRMNLVSEQAASTMENSQNILPIHVYDIRCFLSSSTISRQVEKLSLCTLYKVSSYLLWNSIFQLTRDSSFFLSLKLDAIARNPLTRIDLDSLSAFSASIYFINCCLFSRSRIRLYLFFLICSIMKNISSLAFFLASSRSSRLESVWLKQIQGHQTAPYADIRAMITTPQLTKIQMSTLMWSLLNIPIQSSMFLTTLISVDLADSILRQTRIIMTPNTGILALGPNGIWYMAKGTLSSRSTGITTVHMMTCTARMTFQRVSFIWIIEISYMYMASSETEQENVRMNTALGRNPRICFSMRQRVTMRQPALAKMVTMTQKLVNGYSLNREVKDSNIQYYNITITHHPCNTGCQIYIYICWVLNLYGHCLWLLSIAIQHNLINLLINTEKLFSEIKNKKYYGENCFRVGCMTTRLIFQALVAGFLTWLFKGY